MFLLVLLVRYSRVCLGSCRSCADPLLLALAPAFPCQSRGRVCRTCRVNAWRPKGWCCQRINPCHAFTATVAAASTSNITIIPVPKHIVNVGIVVVVVVMMMNGVFHNVLQSTAAVSVEPPAMASKLVVAVNVLIAVGKGQNVRVRRCALTVNAVQLQPVGGGEA